MTSTRWINFTLFLYGCQLLDRPRRWQRVLNWIMVCLSLVRLSSSIASDLLAFERVTIVESASIAFYAGLTAFVSALIWKRNQMSNFIHQNADLLSASDRKKIMKESRKNFLIWLVVYIYTTQFTSPYSYEQFVKSKAGMLKRMFIPVTMDGLIFIAIAFIGNLYEFSVSMTWMTHAVNVYLINHHVKHLLVMQNLDLINCNRYDSITRITAVTDHFTSIFSFFPFVIMATIFFQSSGFILAQIVGAGFTDVKTKVEALTLSVIFFSTAIYLIYTICKRQTEVESKVQAVVMSYKRNKNISASDQELIRSIESLGRDKLWFVCDIDQSLFLSYLGHLVSFSALFYQLINGQMK